MMKTFYILMMVLAAMVAGGCATATRGVRTYAGEARALGQTAQLVVAAEFDVQSVDGAPHAGGQRRRVRETVYELLPGPHEVVARYYAPFETGANAADRSPFQTLRFEAVAGRRFVIGRRDESRDIVLFVKDAGAAVALDQPPVAMQPAVEKSSREKIPEHVAPGVASAPAAAPQKDGRVEVPRITPLDNLKQWWFYATPQERAQFRQWMDATK